MKDIQYMIHSILVEVECLEDKWVNRVVLTIAHNNFIMHHYLFDMHNIPMK